MNKGLNIQTLKMLSNQYSQNTIVHNYQNENNVKDIHQNSNQDKNIPDTDYNFCKIYYETNDHTLINRLVSLNGIKTMRMLDMKLPQEFNWKAYSKYCQGINSEILIKKHYLESYNRKLDAEQLLNIIIIKRTKLPIDTVILDINNMKVTISVISEDKDNTEHYNVKKYLVDNNLQNKLNEVIKNNTSKYYMIIFDNYNFEYNFMNKICRELENLLDVSSLLLVSEYNLENNMESSTIEYFKINTNYLRTLSEPYVCILNNDLKSNFDYSVTEIGLTLYINQQLKKYINTLTSVDYKFKLSESDNNKLLLRDTLTLFDIYISNIEDNILDNDINKIIELSDEENNDVKHNINNSQIDKITSTLVKSVECIKANIMADKMTNTMADKMTNIIADKMTNIIADKMADKLEINLTQTKPDNKIELDFLLRENNSIMNV
jgi:hypothetical protein